MIVVPAPGYTREDGHENVAAHFPMNANEPDFGKVFSITCFRAYNIVS